MSDLADLGPIPDLCSLCLDPDGRCPQCRGESIGQWDEERLAQGRALRVAVEAAVEKVQRVAAAYPAHTVAGSYCRSVASDLERALGGGF